MTLDRQPKQVVDTDERRHAERARTLQYLDGPTARGDAAGLEDDAVVGEGEELCGAMGHEEHGDRELRLDAQEQAEHIAGELGVEGAGRLVEEQEGRVGEQRAADRDALTLAAGEVRDVAAEERREAQDVEDPHACRFMMDFAANYLGHTVASLGAADLRRVVFQLFPRKVSIEPSEASWVVDTLRAFYTFLKRELGLKQADACLAVLGGDAVKKLEAALSNPGNFGMAKSMVMAGAEAGFDMQSQEGLEAFMQSMSSMPLPPSFPVPGLPQPTSKKTTQGKAASQEKKGKRKAARSARRKSR